MTYETEIKFIIQNRNNPVYFSPNSFLSLAFFLFRLFVDFSLLALFAQDPNPDLDPDFDPRDPNVLAAGDLKLNFNGLYLPFFGLRL